jgi:ubiquinone/menaquinone biosynthesis C-methylase UbiE
VIAPAVLRALLGDAVRLPLEAGFRAVTGLLRRELPPGGSLLDLGCGTGLLRAAAGSREWTGLDRDAGALRVARRRALLPSDRFVEGDARNLPFEEGRFDLALCHGVLHHLDDRDAARAVAELARVVRPGGTLLLCDLVRDGAPPYRRFFYALDKGRWIRNSESLRVLVRGGLEPERECLFRSGVNLKLLLRLRRP